MCIILNLSKGINLCLFKSQQLKNNDFNFFSVCHLLSHLHTISLDFALAIKTNRHMSSLYFYFQTINETRHFFSSKINNKAPYFYAISFIFDVFLTYMLHQIHAYITIICLFVKIFLIKKI